MPGTHGCCSSHAPSYQGIRPQLSCTAHVSATPAVKEGHEEAETGAGARAPGPAAATPCRDTSIWVPAALGFPLPPSTAAMLQRPPRRQPISWEAAERSHQGTHSYSLASAEVKVSLILGTLEQPKASPDPGVVAQAWPCAKERLSQPHPSNPQGRLQKLQAPLTTSISSRACGTWHVPPWCPWERHRELLQSTVP